eukprot:m.581663 g.581663  ORF g.581663 m.581663 type:complete len:144 (+) comp22327_c1_seq12:106-537(+)
MFALDWCVISVTQRVAHLYSRLVTFCRELGRTAKLSVYRRARVGKYAAGRVEEITPIVVVTSRKKKATAAIKQKYIRDEVAKARKVSSVWDKSFSDDGAAMGTKERERELKRMVRQAAKSGSRLDLVITPHAIVNPEFGMTSA